MLRPIAPVLAATAVIAGGLVSTASAAPARAGSAAPAHAADATLPGAAVPFTEYAAANAGTDGLVLSPSRAFTQIAAEATGRRAVRLAAGQHVDFVLTGPADAVDVRYSIPDGPDSSLRISAAGKPIATLPTTAKFSHFYGNYPFTKNPADGGQHHYFDDVRTTFGRVLPAGTRVRLTAAAPTTVDVADFEDVAAPPAEPAGDRPGRPTPARPSRTRSRRARPSNAPSGFRRAPIR
jgi:hypothetical protein